ncbi:hypothetical protein Tco_0697926 [Tanacetum coccineum]
MANNETKFSPSEVCLSDYDSEFLILTSWSDESRMKKGQKEKGNEVMKDKVSQEHVCEEEVSLKNNIRKQSGDLVEMPSEAVEQGMDDHVPDEIDGAKGEQVSNHVVKKGNGYSLKDKNKVKTEHGNEMSMKNQSQRHVHLK